MPKMDLDNEERTKSKLYLSASFILHLLDVSRQNIGRTPVVLKTGILLLHVSFVLYITGFASPYWVLGEKYNFNSDVGGNVAKKTPLEKLLEEIGGNVSVEDVLNSTHFGVWEECAEVKGGGRSVCTIFAEDVDSVILMLGCVGGFILFGLCCWAWLACVHKPKKGRYFFIVISAVIGGLFGLVSLVIFLSVQGVRRYSWSMALFVAGCLLELASAGVFLGGIRRASRQGLFPISVEETADTTTYQPCIVVTGPTPTKNAQPRSVRVIHKAAKTRVHRVLSEEEQQADHVEFVTLDMVTPVPSQPSAVRKKRKRKRRRRTGEGRSVEKNPVASLARQVVEQVTMVDLVSISPPPPPLPPRASIRRHIPTHTNPDQTAEPFILPPKTSQTRTAEDVDPARPASVYIDLTGGDGPIKSFSRHRCPESLHGATKPEPGTFIFPQSDSRQRCVEDARKMETKPAPVCIRADVHHWGDLDDPSSPQSIHMARFASPEPRPREDTALGLTLPVLASSSFRCGATRGNRQSSSRMGVEGGSPGSKGISAGGGGSGDVSWATGGGSGSEEREQGEVQYVRYSPDTYYKTTTLS